MSNKKILAEKKSKAHVLLCAGMIIPAAYLFSYVSDIPLIFALTLLGLFLSLVYSKPFHYSDRSVIYSLLTAVVLSTFGDLLMKMNPDRTGMLSGIFQANLSGPFLLYLAVIATFYKSSPYTLGSCACFSLAATVLGGEMLGIKFENTYMTFFSPWILKHSNRFFGIIILTEFIFILPSLNAARIISKKRISKRQWLKRTFTFFALLLIPALAFFALFLYNSYGDKIKDLEFYFLRRGILRRAGSGQIIFNKNVDLNRTISSEVEKNFNRIVLRATGKIPPGYLRGRVYTEYDNGNWKSAPVGNKQYFQTQEHTGILSYTTFFYSKNEKQSGGAFSIYPAGIFSSDVLLAPGNTQKFDIVANKLSHSRDGIIVPEEWEKDGGYTCLVAEYNQASPYPMPDSANYPDYLQVPDNISKELGVVLYSILKPELWDKKPSDSEVIIKLTSWFLNNFKYSLKTQSAKDMDPVLNFMTKTKKGHCELFASSMVLLLRHYGIPARYVTGFVCEEAHPSGSYYVARVGNAHAWLEAFPRDLKKWEMIEPTPPAGIPNFKHEWGAVESWWDRLKQALQQALANVRRGFFAQGIIDGVKGFAMFFVDILRNPVLGSVILVSFVLIFIFIKRKKRKASQSSILFSPTMEELRKEFARLEKQVAKSTGISRHPAMTLEEWGGKLPGAFASLLAEYQAIRYRRIPPESGDVSQFKKKCRQTLKKM